MSWRKVLAVAGKVAKGGLRLSGLGGIDEIRVLLRSESPKDTNAVVEVLVQDALDNDEKVKGLERRIEELEKKVLLNQKQVGD